MQRPTYQSVTDELVKIFAVLDLRLITTLDKLYQFLLYDSCSILMTHFLLAWISRLCYDASVCLSVRLSVRRSVRLSVTEVHWRIIANLGFKFRSHFTAHCGRRDATVLGASRMCPTNSVYGCAHWRHLANTVEWLCAATLSGSATRAGGENGFQITLHNVAIALQHCTTPPTSVWRRHDVGVMSRHSSIFSCYCHILDRRCCRQKPLILPLFFVFFTGVCLIEQNMASIWPKLYKQYSLGHIEAIFCAVEIKPTKSAIFEKTLIIS